MKSYKSVLNEWARESNLIHHLSDCEIHMLQNVLKDMLCDILDVCEKNNLCVLLGGGSCLGAIRHHDMIPWDDDLDLLMPRNDYDKLIDLLKSGILSDKYAYRFPDGKMKCSCTFLKIYRKGTRFVPFDDDPQFPMCIYIDVFSIDGVPNNRVVRGIKGFVSNALRLIGNCSMDYQVKSETLSKATHENKELSRVVKLRTFIGLCFSFLKYYQWFGLFDKLVSDSNHTRYVTVPSGRNLYCGEMNRGDVFFPTKRVDFSGIPVSVPNKYDVYLKKLYGDYMCIPPEDKREMHFVSELKF